jgi:hypothetical protein
MSRGPIILGALALSVLATGAGLWARRSVSVTPATAAPATAAPAAAPASVTFAYDPTWCGKPLGALNSGELGDASDCGKLSLTGTEPNCLFWAECREDRFQIDCTSAGPGRCRCDGENGLTVPYDPAFCALDATSPRQSLRKILDTAAAACRWTKP